MSLFFYDTPFLFNVLDSIPNFVRMQIQKNIYYGACTYIISRMHGDEDEDEQQ
jgi:hypothetical protein